eukprot:7283921-Prorocentrum_lima.AAC.1
MGKVLNPPSKLAYLCHNGLCWTVPHFFAWGNKQLAQGAAPNGKILVRAREMIKERRCALPNCYRGSLDIMAMFK